jgi:hypothetical protein
VNLFEPVTYYYKKFGKKLCKNLDFFDEDGSRGFVATALCRRAAGTLYDLSKRIDRAMWLQPITFQPDMRVTAESVADLESVEPADLPLA